MGPADLPDWAPDWPALREAWWDGVACGAYVGVGPAGFTGPAVMAAIYDDVWEVLCVSPDGEVLGAAGARVFVIRDDEDPRGVDVTDLLGATAGARPC